MDGIGITVSEMEKFYSNISNISSLEILDLERIYIYFIRL